MAGTLDEKVIGPVERFLRAKTKLNTEEADPAKESAHALSEELKQEIQQQRDEALSNDELACQYRDNFEY